MNDIDLVREYAARNADSAFSELVRRHINLVYSVALRFTRDSGDAEDVTQAVFVILARKAARLLPKTVLTGWLYETTRFTAMKLSRTKARKHAREQEAYMQSTLTEPNTEDAWKQLEPVLERGMSRLGKKDRTLLALRFFDGKTAAETAALLGIRECAAQKRAIRAVEKLRAFFRKCGVVLPAAVITAAISANSVRAAPAALAQSVTAAAVVKGTVASGSILAVMTGVLKLIAWAKMKTTVVIGAALVLATGAVAASMYEIILKNANSCSYGLLHRAPPTLVIRPTKFSTREPHGIGLDKAVYVNQSLPQLLAIAYDIEPWRMILPEKTSAGRFDYLATLPEGQNAAALRNAIQQHFGLVANHRAIEEVDVYILRVVDPARLQSHVSKGGRSIGYSQGADPVIHVLFNEPLSDGSGGNSQQNLRYLLECYLKKPVVDRTASLNRYDIHLEWQRSLYLEPGSQGKKLAAIHNQLDSCGLELAASRERIQMLAVEKAK